MSKPSKVPQKQTASTSGFPGVARAGVKPCKQCEAKHGPKFGECKHVSQKQASAVKEASRAPHARGPSRVATRLRERGKFEFTGRFKESIDGGASGKGKRFRVTMLEEGLGNFGDAFYYTGDAIKSCPPIFEGKKFMLNHPSESEEEDRPERDVRDISGYFENCAAEESEDGRLALMADLVVAGDPSDPTDPFKRERVLMLESIEYAKKHAGQDLAALSINAGGDFDTMPIEQFMETGTIPDVCREKLLEAVKQGVTVVRPVRVMQAAVSCDLVTTAGAGGSINQLLEGGKMKPAAKKPIDAAATQETEESAQHEDEGAADAGASDDVAADDEKGGEHDDADQDEELIKSMLDKYVGDPQHSDDDKAMAKEAYQSAKEAGLEGKEAEKAAGYAMKMAKQKQAKESKAAMEAEEKAQQEAGGLDVKAKPVGDAGSAAKDQKSKESAGGNTVVKLTAEVARLSSELEAIRLEKHMDKALRESKLPMSATKKFRECVKNVRSVKDFDSKLGIFKEAYGLRGDAQSEGGFILSAEKQGGSDGGEVGMDFSDCAQAD